MDADRIFFRYLERPGRRRLARLAKAHYEFAWQTAVRVTDNAEDAEDITQDVFLKLLLAPPRPEDVKSPRGYLAWQVIGRVTNLRRAEGRRAEREKGGILRAHEDGLDADEIALLRSAVLSLPEDQRAAVELRYFAGLRNQDIAAALGIGERHVEKRLEKARETLRERLKHAAPLLAFLAAGEAGAGPSPPAQLWPRLRRVVAMGGAIGVAPAHVSVAATATAVLLAKKIALTATAAALVAALPVAAWRAWETSKERTDASITTRGTRSLPSAALAQLDADAASANAIQKPEEPTEPARSSIHGYVLDDEGAALPGATFTLRRELAEEDTAALREQGYTNVTAGLVQTTATCDGAGLFEIRELLPGKYLTETERDGFVECFHFPVKLEPGEDKERIYRLCRPYRIHGTVTDASGGPIPSARVFVDIHITRPDFSLPVPDPRGKAFPVDDVGRYDTGFDLGIYGPMWDAATGCAVAEGYALKEWKHERSEFKDHELSLDLVLEPEERLLVRVRDSLGAPVDGAEVNPGSCLYAHPLTNESGEALLLNLRKGKLQMYVTKDGYQREELDVEVGSRQILDVVLLPIGPGIEGRVTFDEAIPEASRKVREVYLLEIEESGKIIREVHDVRLDEKTLEFSYHPRKAARYQATCALGLDRRKSEVFYYSGTEKKRVDFRIGLEPPYIAGKVVRAGTDEPVANTGVTIRQPQRDSEPELCWSHIMIVNRVSFPILPANTATTHTARDGSFFFALQGPESIWPWTLDPSRIILVAGSDEAGWSQELYLDAQVRTDTVISDVRLEVLGKGAIEGHVMDFDGKPAMHSLVVAYDGRSVVEWADADKDGNYRIEQLRPGTYTVNVIGNGPSPDRGGGFGGPDSEGLPPPRDFFERPVTVEASQTSRWDIDLRTDALGTIDGVVPEELREATKAVCGLIMYGRPRSGGWLGPDVAVRNGRFRLEHLLPGRYLVWLQKERERLAQTDVFVRRGPPTPVAMRAPTASLSIPLRGLPPDTAADAKLTFLEIHQGFQRQGDWVWERWGGFKTSVLDGVLKVEGLPAGFARFTIYVPGWQAVHLDRVLLTEGSEVTVSASEMVRGRVVRVRIEAPEGIEVPTGVKLTASHAINGEELSFTSRKEGAEPVWTLCGFPPGLVRLSVDAGSTFDAGSAEVSVGADEDADVTVRLTRRSP